MKNLLFRCIFRKMYIKETLAMNKEALKQVIDRIAGTGNEYIPDAFLLVHSAINMAVNKKNRNSHKHVSAKDLLDAVATAAYDKFGPFAEAVLGEWGIGGPRDVGHIVYMLVRENVISANEEDSPGDFDIEYDLFENIRKTAQELDISKVEAPVIV
jgi:uncharacterized repeat protein (TIGR04138 family)